MRNCSRYQSTSARTLLALVLFTAGGCLVVKAASFDAEATNSVSQRTLTFADRVAYQRAVEEVYWQHRIWPKENPRPKPSLDEVMSQQQIQQKVQEYLRNSQLLAGQWQRPITPEQLQAETKRMASHTRQPDVLRELFAALGNDPFIVAECLARPVLSERLVSELHAGSNLPAETELLSSWATKMERALVTTEEPGSIYYLPEITNSMVEDGADGCVDTWTASSIGPRGRWFHTAVWTGTEMIVWGGDTGSGGSNSGGRYTPSTDSWSTTTTTRAPSARSKHTAIWTGTEMIVWGGDAKLNTGGRYNPSTNRWVATTTTGAPNARLNHAAVWTGGEMIVWGGDNISNKLNTGGRYNPSTDSWIAITTTGAPDGRSYPTAVWTGSEMIVWGGFGSASVNTGGRYDPSTDSWVPTSLIGAPSTRFVHTAVWTGTEMIVWGGYGNSRRQFNTGGRYNPSTDSWAATTTIDAPAGRNSHTAVWTGSEMIVWGGEHGNVNQLNTGGKYSPSTDTWVATRTRGAPTPRSYHTAVWTGSEMIVWGGIGDLNTGGRYVPCPAGFEDHSQE